LIQKWIFRVISISVLIFLTISIVSTAQIIKNQQATHIDQLYPYLENTLSAALQRFTDLSSMMTYFYNIGYDITENNGIINSIGLCMQTNIGHSSGFSSSSVIMAEYDENGTFCTDFVKGFQEDIVLLNSMSTNDGNFVVCGGIEKDNPRQTYPVLIKLSQDLDIIWQKEYSSLLNSFAFSIAETDDNGYIVSGIKVVEHENEMDDSYLLLIKTDANGNKQWESIIESDGWMFQRSVIQTEDNGFLLVGDFHPSLSEMTTSDIVVVKTDDSGIVEWQKLIDLSSADFAYDITLCSDGIVIAGYISNSTAPDQIVYTGLLCCVDENGDILWTQMDQFHNQLFYGVETTTNGFLLTGIDNEDNAGFLIQVDAFGQINWKMSTKGLGVCVGMGIEETNDGSYYFTGFTYPILSTPFEFQYYKMITVSVDTDGNKQWEHFYSPSTELTCTYHQKTWRIQNLGIIGAYNISIQYDVTGGLYLGMNKQYNEQMNVILPGEEIQVDTPELFGFGLVTQNLTVTGLNIKPTTTTVTGLLIGPFFVGIS
jgi:hypothetical protein